MDIKNIYTDAGWYASYDGQQGKALILCQQKKIAVLTKLIETIGGEIELAETPKEYDSEMVLHSIKALINQPQPVQHTEGFFKWEG